MLLLNYRSIKLSLSNPGEKIINFRGKQMLRNKPGLQEQQHLSSIFNTQHADFWSPLPVFIHRQSHRGFPA